jgi:hypothetical protein
VRSQRLVCYPNVLPKPSEARCWAVPESKKPRDLQGFCVKRMKGFEPSTFAMARRRSSQLSYIRELPPF